MKIIYSGLSNKGLVRRNNQDSILMCSEGDNALFLVADGIGGKSHGEVASGMLRNGYDKWWREQFLPIRDSIQFKDVIALLRTELLRINNEIIASFGEYSVGSTVVLLFLFHDQCVIISSGDSRIYRAHGLTFKQITRDDTFGNLENKPKDFGPEANSKLVAAVGIQEKLKYTLISEVVRKNDRFLLCSDGVYRFVSENFLMILCV